MEGLAAQKASPFALWSKLPASLEYLAPLSTDTAAIKSAFAKLKAVLRKAVAGTIDEPWNATRNVLATFSRRECENDFTGAGYDPG